MDTAPTSSRILRIDSRHRRWSQDSPLDSEPPRAQDVEEEEESPHDAAPPTMGQAHRLFHRRPVQNTPRVLTVNVEVVATLDGSGKVIAQETVTPATAAPDVLPTTALPSVPSVPAVPPFPSDLTVPAVPSYPWPSGVPSAQAAATSSEPVTTAAPALTTTDGVIVSSEVFSSTVGFNSTSSGISSSSSTLRNSTSSSSSSSSSSSTSSSSPSSTRSSTSSVHTSSTSTTSPWSSSSIVGGAGGSFSPAVSPTPTSPPPAAANSGSSSTPLDTPQVVGTVFGSLAGFALVLALLLFLLRRHKRMRRGGALQLTGDDNTDTNQPITQSAARHSFVPPSFLNRFSGASRSTAESSGTGERSFQRISGRKLPSAFSEGMTSEQFAAGARGGGTLSGSSFYQDEKGFYGGPGVLSKDFGKEIGFDKEIGNPSNIDTKGTEERVRPSPARTPIIHHPDDAPPFGASRNGEGSPFSPPHTPSQDFPPRNTLGRSHPSHDGSRSSRFTENV